MSEMTSVCCLFSYFKRRKVIVMQELMFRKVKKINKS